MKILLVGSGGREHAMAEALRRSPRTTQLFCAPCSDAIARLADPVDLAVDDVAGLVRFASDVGIDLVVIGPEAPLVAGLTDRLEAKGIRVFGPSQAAAMLEGSKVFTKNLLRKYRIPSADSRSFRDMHLAHGYIRGLKRFPVVVKADGLAAGKGVIIAQDANEAMVAVDRMLKNNEFGDAGKHVLVEEFLVGEEASVLAITDGSAVLTLPPAKDHKAAYDGDTGPNTGGMGAYCPTPSIDDATMRRVEQDILIPTLHAMGREHRPYKGVLYAGLMLTEQGPKVLEYNVRFGDPEAQVILPRLLTDFVEIAWRTAEGTLSELGDLEWSDQTALVVVLASPGYPGPSRTGEEITGVEGAEEPDDVTIYHSGTRREGSDWLSAGGRVLGVTALGDDLLDARRKAYKAVGEIGFPGSHFRRDIGVRPG